MDIGIDGFSGGNGMFHYEKQVVPVGRV